MTLLDAVATRLEQLRVPYCVIGASALAAHGLSRATQDIDLFTVAAAALQTSSWAGLPEGVSYELRRGDMFDPLAGVVRFGKPGETDVDLVVGKLRWQVELVDRAVPTVVEGRPLPVVTAADLVLLKLYAGGGKDAWDIGELLRDASSALIASVEEHLPALPEDARELWKRLLSER